MSDIALSKELVKILRTGRGIDLDRSARNLRSHRNYPFPAETLAVARCTLAWPFNGGDLLAFHVFYIDRAEVAVCIVTVFFRQEL